MKLVLIGIAECQTDVHEESERRADGIPKLFIFFAVNMSRAGAAKSDIG